MTKKGILVGILSIVLVFGSLVLGCKSAPTAEDEPEPERTGAKTILEWVKADGIYNLGGNLTIQFMGETWIQKNGDNPYCAGTMTGAPAKPPFIDDDTHFDLEQWIAFLRTISSKEGDINLKVTKAYISNKWQTLDKLEETLNNPIASRAVPQNVKDSFAEFKKGMTLHYELTESAPFINLQKK